MTQARHENVSEGEGRAIADALRRVVDGQTLPAAAMRDVIREMMGGGADERQSAALLAALRTRGETLDEIVGAAEAVRDLALLLPDAPEGAVDTCGTGGDGAHTFNISTAAALVVAAAGTPVAKHGNRRATSLCGSAEVLEALGVPLELSPLRMAECVRAIGIGFLFARACHPAFGAIAPVRAALPIPTLFNRLGPLVNPMRVRRHLVGVGRMDQLDLTLDALVRLGAQRAWVVHSEDGLDELSTCAVAHVRCAIDGERSAFSIEPGKYFARAELASLRGADAEHNAGMIREMLDGEAGPARDVVLLNAAAALCAAGHKDVSDMGDAVDLAARTVDSGAARALLKSWVEWCAAAMVEGRRA